MMGTSESLADAGDDLLPVEIGQAQIEDDEARLAGRAFANALFAARCLDNLIAIRR